MLFFDAGRTPWKATCAALGLHRKLSKLRQEHAWFGLEKEECGRVHAIAEPGFSRLTEGASLETLHRLASGGGATQEQDQPTFFGQIVNEPMNTVDTASPSVLRHQQSHRAASGRDFVSVVRRVYPRFVP